MKLEMFRKRRGLTQRQAATEIGLRSKGYFSRIESGKERPSLRLAAEIEKWSEGEVTITELLPEAATLVRQVQAQAGA